MIKKNFDKIMDMTKEEKINNSNVIKNISYDQKEM